MCRFGAVRAVQMTLLCCALMLHVSAHATMAGAPPDTPASRVDPNSAGSPWTGVGSLVVNGTTFSAVVVAPRFALTAAHVAGGALPSAVQLVLNVGGDRTHVLQAQAIHKYPSASFPYDDLTLVELAAPVPPGVTIYPLFRDAVASSQRITLVGYGASGNGNVGSSVAASSAVKRVGQNMIDAVQTTIDGSGRSSLFYLYDFDGPSGVGSFGGATLGNGIETLVASGDSGSPAFAGGAGSYRLLGINTFVASPTGEPVNYRFGMVGGGMLLARPEFLAWIDATTNYSTPSGDGVDIPTLPEWALIGAMILFGAIAWRPRARAGGA